MSPLLQKRSNTRSGNHCHRAPDQPRSSGHPGHTASPEHKRVMNVLAAVENHWTDADIINAYTTIEAKGRTNATNETFFKAVLEGRKTMLDL